MGEMARVEDLTVRTLVRNTDPRGTLGVLDAVPDVPFPVRRLFWIRDVPSGTSRGAHAHKACHQYFVCLTGRVSVAAFDGRRERDLTLAAEQALHVPPGIFAMETFEEAESVLLVLCDQPYDKGDYLTSREALIAFLKNK